MAGKMNVLLLCLCLYGQRIEIFSELAQNMHDHLVLTLLEICYLLKTLYNSCVLTSMITAVSL